jgi:hypothetical protein
MTLIAEPERIWHTMPGWGIVADLTPPELTNRRQLALIRRLIGIALVGLVVLCAAGYVLATVKNGSARSDLHRANAQTSRLQAQVRSFSNVTEMQTAIAAIKADIAAQMGADVDVQPFLASVSTALPGTMTIQNMSLNLSQAATTAGVAVASGAAPSEYPIIGKVTMTGDALHYADVAKYVDALNGIKGVVNVIPPSSTLQGNVINYSINFNVTTQILSHRYDATTTSGTTR